MGKARWREVWWLISLPSDEWQCVQSAGNVALASALNHPCLPPIQTRPFKKDGRNTEWEGKILAQMLSMTWEVPDTLETRVFLSWPTEEFDSSGVSSSAVMTISWRWHTNVMEAKTCLRWTMLRAYVSNNPRQWMQGRGRGDSSTTFQDSGLMDETENHSLNLSSLTATTTSTKHFLSACSVMHCASCCSGAALTVCLKVLSSQNLAQFSIWGVFIQFWVLVYS